jgi:hypothetical protein
MPCDRFFHIDAKIILWNSRSQIDYPFARGKRDSGISRGRPSPTASQLSRLEVKHSQHWPSKGKQRWCHMCSLHKQTWSTLYFCRKWHWSVHSQLLQEVAYACELESLDITRSGDCSDVRQIISFYSADRKHLPHK